MKIKSLKNFYLKSSLFGLLSVLAAICSYAVYPILIRLLSSSEFGDFAVATATLNQLLAILLAINVISIHLVKKYDEEEARTYAQVIQKVLLWLFIFVCILVLLMSPFLQNVFKIQNISLFIPLIAVLLISVPVTIWNGYLQGHKELIRVGLFSLVSSFAKLVFASLLGVLAGAFGAVFGIFVGTLAGIFLLHYYPGVKLPSLKSVFTKMNKDELLFLSSIKFYIAQAVFVVGGLGVLQFYDISLAKNLFDPHTAGIYSGIGILSNALYYLAFILIWITLPELSIKEPKINRRVLTTAYRLLGGLAFFAITVELILKDLLLSILLGPGFSDKSEVLLFATLYQLTMVAVTLYAFYLLVCRRNRSVLLVSLLLGYCLFIAPIFANDPLSMILALWLATVAAVITYIITMMAYGIVKRFNSDGELPNG